MSIKQVFIIARVRNRTQNGISPKEVIMAHITENFRSLALGGAGSSCSKVIRILSPSFSSALFCTNFILRKISPYNGS